nr:intraflagellar transport protein 46 homolog isoform X3 [Physcomitrium patens]|eukprot:XP_024380179.1 intraflagellar transport protein 46 homolog isoform X3 [Physcomitrella patens]
MDHLKTFTMPNLRPLSSLSFSSMQSSEGYNNEDEDANDSLSNAGNSMTPESVESCESNAHKDLCDNTQLRQLDNESGIISDHALICNSPPLNTKLNKFPRPISYKHGDEGFQPLSNKNSIIGVNDTSSKFIHDGSNNVVDKYSSSYNGCFSSIKSSSSSFNKNFQEIDKQLQELFAYIEAFKPQDIQIGTKLKPFYPNFIPALGSVDEFIKVPPPNGQFQNLGLEVLDEDGPKQTDPSILALQLCSTSMQSNFQAFNVTSIENVEKCPDKLDSWIDSIKTFHRMRPPCTVLYSKPMPDIEKLKQPWPVEIDKVLSEIKLPSANLDVDLATYIDIICAIFDIPMYQSKIETLHVLFMLYLEFKSQSNDMIFSPI